MSVREFPSDDSQSRQRRANEIELTDVREIERDAAFGEGPTVFEVDAVNEDGEVRENLTIVPAILFESTKDVQHRHEYGIVGKYTRALARENETADTELRKAISQKREHISEQIRELKEKDSRLLHTQHDLE